MSALIGNCQISPFHECIPFLFILLFLNPTSVSLFTWLAHLCSFLVMSSHYLFRYWLKNWCAVYLLSVRRSIACLYLSIAANVLTCGGIRWVNETIFFSFFLVIYLGLGFDDETRQLSPSRIRLPHGNSTPEEEQPITMKGSPSDYLSAI